MLERRAILFDLDDTLYPYGAFLRSGFRVVSRHLAEQHGIPAREVFRTLGQALRTNRGRELQTLCARFALPEASVLPLRGMIRDHSPRLSLAPDTVRVLRELRDSWRLGVLTNGTPEIQRRKITALGLDALVDEVFCAVECGDAGGKPTPVVFLTALSQLDADPEQSVFVGNDPRVDIDGAARVGMHTIHITTYEPPDHSCDRSCPGAHVNHIGQVPAVADRLAPRMHHAL